jgi:hypothetical protein
MKARFLYSKPKFSLKMAKRKKPASGGKTKKGPRRDKNKKKTEERTGFLSIRGISAPENFLFGLILIATFIFSYSSLENAKHISTSFPTAKISTEHIAFQKKLQSVVSGYPIEKMAPHISKKNKKVASFLVAIAKKESNWGRFAPTKDGKQCYNYWGYRGPENPTASGYSCFDSPQHAVNVVGGRINDLIAQKIDTPKEMVVWKCGTTSCVHRDRGAAKWIWDVGLYYNKVYPKKNTGKPKQTAYQPPKYQ